MACQVLHGGVQGNCGQGGFVTALQVVVDSFDTSVIVSSCATKVLDLATCPASALHDIRIPLQLSVSISSLTSLHVHCWRIIYRDRNEGPRLVRGRGSY
jgi:hypothetical protein